MDFVQDRQLLHVINNWSLSVVNDWVLHIKAVIKDNYKGKKQR